MDNSCKQPFQKDKHENLYVTRQTKLVVNLEAANNMFYNYALVEYYIQYGLSTYSIILDLTLEAVYYSNYVPLLYQVQVLIGSEYSF